MDKNLIEYRLLWLAIAVVTLGVIALGGYGIQQELVAMHDLDDAETSDTTMP